MLTEEKNKSFVEASVGDMILFPDGNLSLLLEPLQRMENNESVFYKAVFYEFVDQSIFTRYVGELYIDEFVVVSGM